MRKKEELFGQEEETLKRAAETLENAKESQVVALADFEQLLTGYKRMYKQFRTLVVISDKQQNRLNKLKEKLELRSRFIRKTFSRYLSDNVVKLILESPEGAALGGEKREVTVLFGDLRGFTALTERMPAENIVKTLNVYHEIMTDIIYQYKGMIDEFIGDGILAIFGAPLKCENHACQGVACAIEMQKGITVVNERIKKLGLPEIQMGIGISTGELVVGNIGSLKRMKYGVVGSQVNITSRIEAFTAGGQVFISQSTREKCGASLVINRTTEVLPKGMEKPITIYEITGIGGEFNVHLPLEQKQPQQHLIEPLEVHFFFIHDKRVNSKSYTGFLVRFGAGLADILSNRPVREFSELKIVVLKEGPAGTALTFYGKIIALFGEGDSKGFRLKLSSIPPEIEHFLASYQM